MNRVIVTGRLTKDPEIRVNGNTTVAKFTVAAQRNFKDKDGNYGADFILCTAFGKTSEILEKYFHKGSLIGVTGRINTGSFTNKDGQKVFTTDVAVDSIEFIGSKAENDLAQAKKEESPKTDVADGFMNIPEGADEDLPMFG